MNRFSTLWSNFTSPLTSPDEDGSCSICCGLDFTSLSRRYGGGLRGPFRVNVRLSDLTPNLHRCVTCTVILVGLDKIGAVLKDDRPEEVVLLCSIADGHPMRIKVYLRGNTVPVSELEFFTTQGSPRTIDAFGQTAYVYRNPLSAESIARVKGWIEDCQATHPRCRSSRSGTLPWRVIDVGASPSDDSVLVETFGDQTGDYVALSHCWGGHRPLITTTDSLDRRKAGIKWFSLPQTFKDAVLFTRKLGLRYLWIDSLCTYTDRYFVSIGPKSRLQPPYTQALH